MSGAIWSIIFSVVLVVLEYAGVYLSKWRVESQRFEQAARRYERAEMVAAIQDGNHAGLSAEVIQGLVDDRMAQARLRASEEHLDSVFWSTLPGPELCFMSLTLTGAVFFSYFYSTAAERVVISPILAKSGADFVILGVVAIVLAVTWVLSLVLREQYILRTHPGESRLRHPVTIGTIGAVSLFASIFIIAGGR
ncbi:MAG: hypothetical protein H6742_18330 [Alphaproteobacteria bacterium]|nr:hypothetical protein [Alphaproteobacteria bacterium]